MDTKYDWLQLGTWCQQNVRQLLEQASADETVRLLCFCAAHCQVLTLCPCSSSRSCSSGPLRKMSSTRRRTPTLPLLYRGSLKSKVCLQFLFLSYWVKFTGTILGIKAQWHIIIFICTYIFIGMSGFIAWDSLIFRWCPNSESRLRISFFLLPSACLRSFQTPSTDLEQLTKFRNYSCVAALIRSKSSPKCVDIWQSCPGFKFDKEEKLMSRSHYEKAPLWQTL